MQTRWPEPIRLACQLFMAKDKLGLVTGKVNWKLEERVPQAVKKSVFWIHSGNEHMWFLTTYTRVFCISVYEACVACFVGVKSRFHSMLIALTSDERSGFCNCDQPIHKKMSRDNPYADEAWYVWVSNFVLCSGILICVGPHLDGHDRWRRGLADVCSSPAPRRGLLWWAHMARLSSICSKSWRNPVLFCRKDA